MKKRLISTLLVLCMVLGMLPGTAFADNTARTEPSNVISTDGYYTSLIDENNTLWTWGDSIYNDNQLGNGTIEGSNVPVKVIDNAVTVVREKQSSRGSNAVITADGSLWMWGQNQSGQLGTGTRESSSVPVKVLDNVSSVSLGGVRTAAVKKDGSLWTWGNAGGSIWGMIGNGTQDGSLVPIKIMDGVASVSCGEAHIAALKTDGSLWLWGDGTALGRGDGNSLPKGESYHSPTPIKIMDDVAYVSAGCGTTVAIKKDGSLWSWGRGWSGELGNGAIGTTEYAYFPVKIMDNVSSVKLYSDFSYPAVAAITTDGSLWMWGDNEYGQLGNGTTQDSYVPAKIMDDVASVSMGTTHTAAIKNDGSLWIWGENDYGQLGTGTRQDSLIPVKVMDDVATVALEVNSTFVGKKDKTVWVFGSNGFGYLGLGYRCDAITTPTQIENLTVKVPGSVTPPGPGTDPDPDNPPKPTGSPEITSLYPANGATFDFANTSADTRPRIFFDREVADVHGGRAGLDFSKGTLQIHRASDDAVVYEVKESSFGTGYSEQVLLWGEGADALAPKAVRLMDVTTKLDYDTEYYVTMPAGFIRMADGSGCPAIVKGEWGFRTANDCSPIMPLKSGEFKFHSDFLKGQKDENITYDYDYDESWFLTNSTVYQHGLVRMSLRAALAAFGTQGIDEKGNEVPYSSSNIKSLMKDLGYKRFIDAYSRPSHDSVGYAIGSKNVRTAAGDEFSIVMVAVRGGGYYKEWGGNFNVGMTKEHNGFQIAADSVIKGIGEYIDNYGETLLPDKKIWIMGYSRGAATTNLVAARLNDGWIDDINAQNVYAFCFACPQNIDNSKEANTKDPTKKEDLVSNYTNIKNIVNPFDLIPKVVMSGSGWEYSRYGETYYLPSLDISLNNYIAMSGKVDKKYSELLTKYGINASDYIPQNASKTFLRDILADLLAFATINSPYYVSNFQNWLISEGGEYLGKESKENFIKKLIAFNDAMDAANTFTDSKIARVIAAITQEAEGIVLSHYGELYLSWLDALEGAHDYSKNVNYRIVYINCPVNVEVYDVNNILVGQTKGDSIIDIENGVGVLIDENEQKVVVLPADEEYTIQLTATDRGEVTYTVAERSIESGVVEKVVSYYQVDVELGDQLTGAVENLGTTATADYPFMINNIPVTPSIVQDGDDLSLHEVLALCNGHGAVNGGGYYISGEYAKVAATANPGETFLGWYVDDNLVSTDAEYRFLVDRDVSITAKFTQNTSTPDVPVTPNPTYPISGNTGGSSSPVSHSIKVPTSKGGTVTASLKSAAEGSTVTITATPNSDYELTSLAVTDSKGNELELTDKGGGKYTFVMPASAVTVNAAFTKEASAPAGNDTIDEPYLFPFTDVLRADWFSDAVWYVFSNDLMSGTAPYTFNPQGKMNRAMVWTVLGRMADADVDDSDSAWYSKAQKWAITNNVSDGTSPTNNISRQELMTMLWRYMGSPAAAADLSKFSDTGSVAGWADAAMQWAVSTGLIVGDNGRLNPTGDARRCEVAMIFTRFCKSIAE